MFLIAFRRLKDDGAFHDHSGHQTGFQGKRLLVALTTVLPTEHSGCHAAVLITVSANAPVLIGTVVDGPPAAKDFKYSLMV